METKSYFNSNNLNMNDIKVYEELTYIYTFDDKVYPTPIAVKDLEMLLNGNNRFINLGNDLIAVSSIKRVESRKVDSVENAIYQISDSKLREEVISEISKRKSEWKKTNMEIFQNILDRLLENKW